MNRKFDSLDKTDQEIKKDNKDLRKQNAQLVSDVTDLKSKLATVETTLTKTTRKQDMLEMQSKQCNLKVFGIAGNNNKNSDDLTEVLNTNFSKHLNLSE